MKTNYLDLLTNIEFDEKQTDETEKFGIYRVPASKGCIEFVKLYKNMVYKPHIHDHASAKLIFLKGSGKVIIGDNQFDYTEGSTFEAPSGVLHGFLQEEETIFLSIQTNPIQNRDTGEIDIRYQ